MMDLRRNPNADTLQENTNQAPEIPVPFLSEQFLVWLISLQK
jgi:hypothetical protein